LKLDKPDEMGTLMTVLATISHISKFEKSMCIINNRILGLFVIKRTFCMILSILLKTRVARFFLIQCTQTGENKPNYYRNKIYIPDDLNIRIPNGHKINQNVPL
jgi:hypothetical protein